MLSGLIVGSLVYRYYVFGLFYHEQKEITAAQKKISLEHREILYHHKRQQELEKRLSDGRPRILIKVETD
ncbi:MAG: hypothetical protein A2621_04685 [Alphaproteobacteria bacterium RIFCSPHIGHO2_01_FULL_41_14]|nr:MAG: hypothetical protein A2065_00100 [Alphaproteobacteria bacterium GWB1_45_5]OFW76087.1 MAG: hypothetical protein A3K20_03055 [Alphaproteobacteria bacterium GWA1_45_9]OFW90257.1 MAG: hypothetical protein A2621_04685 [Alphaproteobacteria bacterium RIFCSPHIGHO2_01_FULL_41_14]HCI48281.1 hypothetical protein [Holosporales bacterium]